MPPAIADRDALQKPVRRGKDCKAPISDSFTLKAHITYRRKYFMEPKVFVIIVNWNGEDDTVKCLESLLALEYSNCHVLISDNGSRPESIQLLKTWGENHVSPGGSGIC